MKFFAPQGHKFNFLNLFIMYATVIRNDYNNVVKVVVRCSETRAKKAGKFFTKHGGWYTTGEVVQDENGEYYVKNCPEITIKKEMVENRTL